MKTGRLVRNLAIIGGAAVLAALAVNWWVVPTLVRQELDDSSEVRREATDERADQGASAAETPPAGGSRLAESAEALDRLIKRTTVEGEADGRQTGGRETGETGRDDNPTAAASDESSSNGSERESESGDDGQDAPVEKNGAVNQEEAARQDREADGHEADTSESVPEASSQESRRRVFHLDRREVDRQLEESENVSDQVRTRPEYDSEGNSVGVQIDGLTGVFAHLGLRAGDVVTAINGRPVTNKLGAIAHLRAMRDRNVFDFTIRREGVRRVVRYVLEE